MEYFPYNYTRNYNRLVADRIMQKGGKTKKKGFFGRLGKTLGNIGKGIADAAITPFGGGNLIKDSWFDKVPGISHAAGFIGDQALGMFDLTTNTILGKDIIKDGAYQTGIGRSIGNTMGNLGNQFGTIAVPALAPLVGIPPHIAAMGRNAISNMNFGGQDQGGQGGMYGFNPYINFSGGNFGGSNFSNIFGDLTKLERGGVTRYKNGGLVDIQAEKGEYVFHPTLALTPVHARRSHNQMEKSKDGDIVTDHPLDGSFIFSDYLKLKKSDMDEIVVGVKRHPYKENVKGKEPIVFSVGDLYKKGEKKLTPATLASRINTKFGTRNNDKDVFDVVGDELNRTNRLPYLESIAVLSEAEKSKDEMIYKKGGEVRKRYLRLKQTGSRVEEDITPLPTMPYGIPPYVHPDYRRPEVTVSPIPQPGLEATRPQPSVDELLGRPDYSWLYDGQTGGGQQAAPPAPTSNAAMQWGQGMMTAGALGNMGANMTGAIGSFNLYNNFIKENPAFFDTQRGYLNRSHDIAGMGNIASMGLIGAQQAPEDMEEMDLSRVRGFNPYQSLQYNRMLADQSLGETRNLLGRFRNRDSRDLVNLNIANVVGQNNQMLAGAHQQALQADFGQRQTLDNLDNQNRQIRYQNMLGRTNFGNQQLQQMQQPLGGLFSSESNRQLGLAGINQAQRQTDIDFRTNRLNEPLRYLSTGFQGLADTGAQMYGRGASQLNQGGSGGFDINSIASSLLPMLMDQLKPKKKGGKVKRYKL